MDIMEAYDDATQTWSVVGRLPCPMSHMAATAADVSMMCLTQRIAAGSHRVSGTGAANGGGGVTPTTSISG